MKKLLSFLVLIFCANIVYGAGSVVLKNNELTKTSIVNQNSYQTSIVSNSMKNIAINSELYTVQNCDKIINLFLKCINKSDYISAQMFLLNYTAFFNDQHIDSPQKWKDFVKQQYVVWQKKAEEQPSNADNYAILSGLAYALGNFQEAILYSRKAQKYAPDKYIRLTANYYFASNMFDMAKEENLTQLNHQPNNYDIINNLSVIAFIQKDYNKAINYCKILIAKDTKHKPSAMVSVYWVLKQNNTPVPQILSYLIVPESLSDYRNKYDAALLKSALYMLKNNQTGTAAALIEDSYNYNKNNNDFYLYAANQIYAKKDKDNAKKIFNLIDYSKLTKEQQLKYNTLKKTLK